MGNEQIIALLPTTCMVYTAKCRYPIRSVLAMSLTSGRKGGGSTTWHEARKEPPMFSVLCLSDLSIALSQKRAMEFNFTCIRDVTFEVPGAARDGEFSIELYVNIHSV